MLQVSRAFSDTCIGTNVACICMLHIAMGSLDVFSMICSAVQMWNQPGEAKAKDVL